MPKFLAISESKLVRRRPKALQGETKPESKDREGEGEGKKTNSKPIESFEKG